jgi:hypothetical protein
MFSKTKAKVAEKISEPIRNTAVIAVTALVFAIMAFFVAVSR